MQWGGGRGCRDIPLGADGAPGPGCTISVIRFFRSAPITWPRPDLHKPGLCRLFGMLSGSNEASFLA